MQAWLWPTSVHQFSAVTKCHSTTLARQQLIAFTLLNIFFGNCSIYFNTRLLWPSSPNQLWKNLTNFLSPNLHCNQLSQHQFSKMTSHSVCLAQYNFGKLFNLSLYTLILVLLHFLFLFCIYQYFLTQIFLS